MSGHSKWSKVKHQKEFTDKAKGRIFTKMATAIIIAVKKNGGITDPDSNFKLRLAIEKAKKFNMPKENIERAIDRAKGVGDENELEEVIYEAFGPAGVGLIIEAATNNKQRTVSEIKNILERNGGVLVESGGVKHFFRYTGKIRLVKNDQSFDSVMEKAINLGAIDIIETEDIEVYVNPEDLHRIKESLTNQGCEVSEAELLYSPVTYIDINDLQTRDKVTRLVSLLDENDDVQKVFANFHDEPK